LRGNGLTRLLKVIAPGFIASVSEVDACAIIYLVFVGYSFKYEFLWVLAFSTLLYVFILQLTSEVTLVTGKGIAQCIRERYGRRFITLTIFTTISSNMALLSIELLGAGLSLTVLTGLPLRVTVLIAMLILLGLVVSGAMDEVDNVLMGLGLTLLAYVLVAVCSKPPIEQVATGILKPRIEISWNYLSVVIAIMGTLISPYGIFYQSSNLAGKKLPITTLTLSFDGILLGALVNFLVCTAIVMTGAAINTLEVVEGVLIVFRSMVGEGASLVFALGLFSGSILTGTVILYSTLALISEVYEAKLLTHSPYRRLEALMIIVLSVIAGGIPALVDLNYVRIAFIAGLLSTAFTVFPLIGLARLYSDDGVMGEFKASTIMKVCTWTIISFFILLNLALLTLSVPYTPLLGHVTIPIEGLLSFVVVAVAAYIAGRRDVVGRLVKAKRKHLKHNFNSGFAGV